MNSPRKKIWTDIYGRYASLGKQSSQQSRGINLEPKLLEGLANGASWTDMVSSEWFNIYGAYYDEAHAFPIDDSERIKINKDIHRTFSVFRSSLSFTSLFSFTMNKSTYCKRLGDVLLASTHHNEYCQGMNFITAALILADKSPRDVYILLNFLLHQRYVGLLFNPKSSSLVEYIQIFDEKFRKFEQKLYFHLKHMNFTSYCYAIEWFTTCFIVTCPGDLSHCVLDLLFAGFDDIMIRIGLAIMNVLKEELLLLDEEGLMSEFKIKVRALKPVNIIPLALSYKIRESACILEVMYKNIDKMDPFAKELVGTAKHIGTDINGMESDDPNMFDDDDIVPRVLKARPVGQSWKTKNVIYLAQQSPSMSMYMLQEEFSRSPPMMTLDEEDTVTDPDTDFHHEPATTTTTSFTSRSDYISYSSYSPTQQQLLSSSSSSSHGHVLDSNSNSDHGVFNVNPIEQEQQGKGEGEENRHDDDDDAVAVEDRQADADVDGVIEHSSSSESDTQQHQQQMSSETSPHVIFTDWFSFDKHISPSAAAAAQYASTTHYDSISFNSERSQRRRLGQGLGHHLQDDINEEVENDLKDDVDNDNDITRVVTVTTVTTAVDCRANVNGIALSENRQEQQQQHDVQQQRADHDQDLKEHDLSISHSDWSTINVEQTETETEISDHGSCSFVHYTTSSTPPLDAVDIDVDNEDENDIVGSGSASAELNEESNGGHSLLLPSLLPSPLSLPTSSTTSTTTTTTEVPCSR